MSKLLLTYGLTEAEIENIDTEASVILPIANGASKFVFRNIAHALNELHNTANLLQVEVHHSVPVKSGEFNTLKHNLTKNLKLCL